MELTWSQHFCLACDKQTSGGAYCSQVCRLADHESSSTYPDSSSSSSSSSSSPSFPPSSDYTFTDPSMSQNRPRGSGFYLSPAINFEAYRSSSSTARPTKDGTPRDLDQQQQHQWQPLLQNQRASYMAFATTSNLTKSLSPSSSRSSLSSSSSSSSQQHRLPEKVHSELLAYEMAFDSTRNWRRRQTWS